MTNTVPPRAGPRPRTTMCAPHSQIDQLPSQADGAMLSQALMSALANLTHVVLGGSYRAPPGTVGFHIEPSHAKADDRVFLLGHEFAHIHVEDDFSLHAILPEPLLGAAITAGWAERHPFAGQPTVSHDTVMIYAPRNDEEVAVVADLVRRSWQNAHD